MALSDISAFLAGNNFLIVIMIVLGFGIWKFIIQPIANEDDPIPGTVEKDQKERFYKSKKSGSYEWY